MRTISAVLAIIFLAGCMTVPPANKNVYQVDSFVKIEIFLDKDRVSSGSGAVIKQTSEFTVVLTAAHVCLPFDLLLYSVAHQRNLIIKAHGQNAQVMDIDPKNDICTMKVLSGLYDKPSLKISSTAPQMGELFYNMASPLGMADMETGMIGLFSGTYMGYSNIIGIDRDVFGIPAAGGSSGSSIMNSRGEVVSIITHGRNGFENFAAGPRHEVFYKFVQNSIGMLK